MEGDDSKSAHAAENVKPVDAGGNSSPSNADIMKYLKGLDTKMAGMDTNISRIDKKLEKLDILEKKVDNLGLRFLNTHIYFPKNSVVDR